jgi:hypothetical protein
MISSPAASLTHMKISETRIPLLAGGLGLLAVLAVFGAQRGGSQQMATVGMTTPLPVYVMNEPSMPEDFVAGSTWQFTTWTVPNSMTWSARVEKVSGGWALLSVQAAGQSVTGWYYVPQMPGRWERR